MPPFEGTVSFSLEFSVGGANPHMSPSLAIAADGPVITAIEASPPWQGVCALLHEYPLLPHGDLVSEVAASCNTSLTCVPAETIAALDAIWGYTQGWSPDAYPVIPSQPCLSSTPQVRTA